MFVKGIGAVGDNSLKVLKEVSRPATFVVTEVGKSLQRMDSVHPSSCPAGEDGEEGGLEDLRKSVMKTWQGASKLFESTEGLPSFATLAQRNMFSSTKSRMDRAPVPAVKVLKEGVLELLHELPPTLWGESLQKHGNQGLSGSASVGAEKVGAERGPRGALLTWVRWHCQVVDGALVLSRQSHFSDHPLTALLLTGSCKVEPLQVHSLTSQHSRGDAEVK